MNNLHKTHRLFFALWPSDRVRQSIVETFSRLPQQKQGRVVQPQNLHITLHFAGSVTQETRDCMHAAAQTVCVKPFEFRLDHFGYFPRARILWMGCQEVPVEVKQLYDKLAAAIKSCGYQQEQRAYAPHITLKRKCLKPDLPQFDFSIPWKVDEFVLVESITHAEGVEYQIVERYSLL